jgi:hypothetical protein
LTAIPARIGLQQRVLPSYRAPLFDALAAETEGGLSVFTGQPRPHESIQTGTLQTARHAPARNVHLLGGRFYFCWQRGIIDWLEDWLPDVLIVEANPRYLRTPAAVRWMHNRRCPVIGWGLGAPAVSGLSGSCVPVRAVVFWNSLTPCSPTVARVRPNMPQLVFHQSASS